jgi:hypothetical protein
MLEPEETLTLFFPPLGPGRGRDTPALVIHCQECGDHYAIGLAFQEPWPEREEIRTD